VKGNALLIGSAGRAGTMVNQSVVERAAGIVDICGLIRPCKAWHAALRGQGGGPCVRFPMRPGDASTVKYCQY